MSEFLFEILQRRKSSAHEWLESWARLSPSGEEEIYHQLIDEASFLSPDYIIRVGRWKDSAKTNDRWRANLASVAYLAWLAASTEVFQCPAELDVAQFLREWSERKLPEVRRTGEKVERRFGMSRATTLLHFISGGRYPIIDSRVQEALRRLTAKRLPSLTPKSFLEFYCPLLDQLAASCGTEGDRRRLDNALFYYGAWDPKKSGL